MVRPARRPQAAVQLDAAVREEPPRQETMNFTSAAEGIQLKLPRTVFRDQPLWSRVCTSADP